MILQPKKVKEFKFFKTSEGERQKWTSNSLITTIRLDEYFTKLKFVVQCIIDQKFYLGRTAFERKFVVL